MGERPLLVVLSGAPGSGKTTLARSLGDALHLPVVSRDLIKTGLHVTHRSADPAEVHRFAGAAFDAFFAVVGELLDRGVSVVAEAAFHAEPAGAELAALAERADLAHVALRVDPEVSARRYRERHERGERHPGHGDATFAAAMADPSFDWARYRIADPPPCVVVDTTDGVVPGLAAIVAAIVAAIEAQRGR